MSPLLSNSSVHILTVDIRREVVVVLLVYVHSKPLYILSILSSPSLDCTKVVKNCSWLLRLIIQQGFAH